MRRRETATHLFLISLHHAVCSICITALPGHIQQTALSHECDILNIETTRLREVSWHSLLSVLRHGWKGSVGDQHMCNQQFYVISLSLLTTNPAALAIRHASGSKPHCHTNATFSMHMQQEIRHVCVHSHTPQRHVVCEWSVRPCMELNMSSLLRPLPSRHCVTLKHISKFCIPKREGVETGTRSFLGYTEWSWHGEDQGQSHASIW